MSESLKGTALPSSNQGEDSRNLTPDTFLTSSFAEQQMLGKYLKNQSYPSRVVTATQIFGKIKKNIIRKKIVK
jgi:hypothetical protein